MTRFKKAILAVVCLAALSGVARAVWDSTTGNMPNYYGLCFGSNSTDCFSGNSIAHALSLVVNGSTALSINSSQAVSVPGALTVTGAQINNGTMTINGATTITAQTVLTPVTTTFLATAVPISTGAVMNVQFYTSGTLGSSFGQCISSGILAGAWIYPSTSTTATVRGCN